MATLTCDATVKLVLRSSRAKISGRFDVCRCSSVSVALAGDRGYDSDPLDGTLMRTYGIEMIAANRRGRARTQDGRPLRRIRRRWKIERFLRVAPQLPARRHPMGTPPRELARHGPACLCADPTAGVEMTSSSQARADNNGPLP